MSKEMRALKHLSPSTLAPPVWAGKRLLQFVQQLNERCLELLSRMAHADSDGSTHTFIHLHQGLWRRLQAADRRRAARLPFILVDIHFMDPEWWQNAFEISEETSPASETDSLSVKISEQLVTETLMFVWHAVQSDPRSAVVSVGMSKEVSSILARLGAHDIRRVASRCRGEVRPRWWNAPEWWRRLLEAALKESDTALHETHLAAKLMLCGELLSQ